MTATSTRIAARARSSRSLRVVAAGAAERQRQQPPADVPQRHASSSRSTSSSATAPGNVVRGLTAADFEVREDGQPQEVLGLSFEEISDNGRDADSTTAELLAGVERADGGDVAGAPPSSPSR